MRSNRKFILLAFALGTFVTLRLTMGPSWHGHHPHHACAENCERLPVEDNAQ